MSAAGACYHCGEPLPPGCSLVVRVAGADRPVCCPGCQAVAMMIQDAGLERYYRFREAEARTADDDVEALAAAWSALGRRPDYQGEATGKDGERELLLQVDGIRCGACAWLIRQHVGDLASVRDVHVDTATGYTRITWIPAQGDLGTIARSLLEVGYKPHLPLAAGGVRERRAVQREWLKRIGVAGLGMMQVMMYAVGLYLGPSQDIDPTAYRFLQWVSLVIATPVVLYSARPFFVGAWRDLRHRSPGMDVPVALAIGAAYLFSTVNFFRGAGEVYFDSVVMFTFFLLVARYVELTLRHRNLDAGTALARLLPEWAGRVGTDGVETIPASELAVGDRVRVAAGEAFPADGTLLAEAAEVNEALLTGEATPVVRRRGEPVIAGSLNLAQPVDIEVTASGDETTVSALGRMLIRAQTERPRAIALTDRIAGGFVTAVLVIAAITGWWWYHADPARAFSVVLAVLVASCPCALSLAIPAARTAASRALLQRGVLLTRGRALDRLPAVDHVVFDKTGTLTRGEPELHELRLNPARDDVDEATTLAVAAALETHSRHPIAHAFAPHARGDVSAEAVSVHAGHGIEGRVDSDAWRLGHAVYAAPAMTGDENDKWPIWLADGDGWVAAFRIGDGLRAGAAGAVRALENDGLAVHLVSGDHEPAVAQLAEELGIGQWAARQSPERKLALIRQLQRAGDVVLMVGDGVNDAPVLAGADVSFAVQGGSELANAAADLIGIDESLAAIADARDVAARTRRVVRQNLAWAIGYNLLAIPFAAGGVLQPWMAAIGMSLSSLVVVLNAARLGRRRDMLAAGSTSPRGAPTHA